MVVEDGRVDVDGEALVPRAALIAGTARVEHTLLRHRLVVVVAQAVEMHREEQVRRRREQVQLLLQKQRAGAQGHEFLALDEARDDLADLLVKQGLAAGDQLPSAPRSPFVHGGAAFLRRHAPVKYGVAG